MLFVLLKNQLTFLLPLVLPLNFHFKFIIFGPFPFTGIYHETIHGLPSTLLVNCLCGKKTRWQHPKHTAVAGKDQNTIDVNSRAAFAALNARIVHTHLSTITSNPEKGKLERQLKMLLQRAFKLSVSLNKLLL